MAADAPPAARQWSGRARLRTATGSPTSAGAHRAARRLDVPDRPGDREVMGSGSGGGARARSASQPSDEPKRAGEPQRAGGSEPSLDPAWADALAFFESHLRAERGRSPATVRAYLGDLDQPLRARRPARPCRARPARRRGDPQLAGPHAYARLRSVHAVARAPRRCARSAASPIGAGRWPATSPRGSRWRAAAAPCPTSCRPPRPSRRSTEWRAPASAPAPAGEPAAASTAAAAVRFVTGSSSNCSTRTAMRVSELCGLDVDDIDAGRRLLRVIGKGDRERRVPYGGPAEHALDGGCGRGDPRLVRAGSGPALLLGVRGRRLDPRTARTVVHEWTKRLAGCSRTGATWPTPQRSHSHVGAWCRFEKHPGVAGSR